MEGASLAVCMGGSASLKAPITFGESALWGALHHAVSVWFERPSACAQADSFVHVYTPPVEFFDGTKTLFLCDCDKMGPAWASMLGSDMSLYTHAAAVAPCERCMHSLAAEEVMKAKQVAGRYGLCSYVHAMPVERGLTCWSLSCAPLVHAGYEQLTPGPMLEGLVPIISGDPHVYVLRAKPLLVSIAIASPDSGGSTDPSQHPKQRAIISTEARVFVCQTCHPKQRYSCAHVKALSSFADQQQDAAAGETVFDDYCMRSEAGPSARAAPDGSADDAPSVSQTPIPLDFMNDAMRCRADFSGANLLASAPGTQHLQRTAADS